MLFISGISPSNQDYCWRDPVHNKTSMRADLEVDNLTLEQVPCFLYSIDQLNIFICINALIMSPIRSSHDLSN